MSEYFHLRAVFMCGLYHRLYFSYVFGCSSAYSCRIHTFSCFDTKFISTSTSISFCLFAFAFFLKKKAMWISAINHVLLGWNDKTLFFGFLLQVHRGILAKWLQYSVAKIWTRGVTTTKSRLSLKNVKHRLQICFWRRVKIYKKWF